MDKKLFDAHSKLADYFVWVMDAVPSISFYDSNNPYNHLLISHNNCPTGCYGLQIATDGCPVRIFALPKEQLKQYIVNLFVNCGYKADIPHMSTSVYNQPIGERASYLAMDPVKKGYYWSDTFSNKDAVVFKIGTAPFDIGVRQYLENVGMEDRDFNGDYNWAYKPEKNPPTFEEALENCMS